jgi:hypothetical protein
MGDQKGSLENYEELDMPDYPCYILINVHLKKGGGLNDRLNWGLHPIA